MWLALQIVLILEACLLALYETSRPQLDAASPQETLHVTLQPRGASSVGERLLSPAGEAHQANGSSFLTLLTENQHLRASGAEGASSLSSVDQGKPIHDDILIKLKPEDVDEKSPKEVQAMVLPKINSEISKYCEKHRIPGDQIKVHDNDKVHGSEVKVNDQNGGAIGTVWINKFGGTGRWAAGFDLGELGKGPGALSKTSFAGRFPLKLYVKLEYESQTKRKAVDTEASYEQALKDSGIPGEDGIEVADFRAINNGDLELAPPGPAEDLTDPNTPKKGTYMNDLKTLLGELQPKTGKVARMLHQSSKNGQDAKKAIDTWIKAAKTQRTSGNIEFHKALPKVLDIINEPKDGVLDRIEGVIKKSQVRAGMRHE